MHVACQKDNDDDDGDGGENEQSGGKRLLFSRAASPRAIPRSGRPRSQLPKRPQTPPPPSRLPSVAAAVSARPARRRTFELESSCARRARLWAWAFRPTREREREKEREKERGHARVAADGRGRSSQEVLKAELHLAVNDSRGGNDVS